MTLTRTDLRIWSHSRESMGAVDDATALADVADDSTCEPAPHSIQGSCEARHAHGHRVHVEADLVCLEQHHHDAG